MAGHGGGTGKFYAEFCNYGSSGGGSTVIGIGNYESLAGGSDPTTSHNDAVIYYYDYITSNLTRVDIGGNYASPPGISGNEVLRMAWDCSNGKVWIGGSQEWFDVGSGVGDPANGNNPSGTISSFSGAPIGVLHNRASNAGRCIMNFGQNGTFNNTLTAGGYSDANGIGDFFYAVPNGFLALCSSNLPEPAIGPNSAEQADDNFNTVLWSGNSTNSRSITTGHATDWIWIKKRGTTVQSHVIADTVRGTSNNSGTGNVGILASNLTSAESTNSSDSGIASFDSTGFTIGAGSNTANANAPYQGTNASGHTYVGWSWKAGGTAVSNSDGTNITSNVSANTDAGFSIVSWTGTGVGSDTVGHGLTKKPEVVIVKNRDGDSSPNYWHINHKDLAAADNNIFLNLTSAATDVNTNYSNGGIGLGDANVIDFVAGYSGANYVANANKSGSDYIAYCFHEVQGYSKFGKFSGNGADDGPFIWTGFRPSIVITKRTDAANDWHIMDDQRNPINVMDGLLFANLTTIETSDASYNRDFLSNGFKIRGSEAYVNASGGTFIYLAFAHSPFKFANAF
jgi:hypothetical protein